MARRLAPESRERLRERLGGGSAELPFAEAVVLQAAHPLGGAPSPAERVVVERVADLLSGLGRGVVSEAALAASLAAEPQLLAALFQNVDLLYAHGAARADAVSLLVMRALELLDGD